MRGTLEPCATPIQVVDLMDLVPRLQKEEAYCPNVLCSNGCGDYQHLNCLAAMQRMYGDALVCISTLDSIGIMASYIHPDKLERWPMPYGDMAHSPPALAFFETAQKGWEGEFASWLMGARVAGHRSMIAVLGEVESPVQWVQHENRSGLIQGIWRATFK